MSQLREIIPGSAVTLHFSLSLPDGTPAISTFDDEPLSFYMGDKTFQPSMEIALYGLKAGDEQTLTLTTNQAYGEPDLTMKVLRRATSQYHKRTTEKRPVQPTSVNFASPFGASSLCTKRKAKPRPLSELFKNWTGKTRGGWNAAT